MKFHMHFPETYVCDCPWRHPLSIHDGRGASQNRGPDGSQTGGGGQELQVSNMRWKHDELPWALRAYWTGKTCVSHWIFDKDNQSASLCMLLLLKAADWSRECDDLLYVHMLRVHSLWFIVYWQCFLVWCHCHFIILATTYPHIIMHFHYTHTHPRPSPLPHT